MAKRATLEVYLAVDETGSYELGTTRDDVVERFSDNQGFDGPLAVYHLTVDVPLPVVREATITLADDAPCEVIANVAE